MKKFFKIGCLGFIVLVAIIIVIAVASGGNDDSSKNTSSGGDSKQEAKKSSYTMGQEVKVGDMNYTVNDKSTADQVGPSSLPEKASQKFLVVDVKVKNNGKEAVMVDSSFFKLKRGGKTYEADAAASLSANQGEDGNITNSFMAQDLNPDSEMSGKVVFDLAPEVAEATDLQLQVQTGAFGTETELINLK
ncbi:DUF4352 domain-containing protein [Priestia aryabhattai]|uniref:DUF4352 domain-containing protein n=1 Tax=Priestia aryabhattai TaxID=412384 RepID=A0ABD7X2I3_PRIAR|nr:DUF4352 domain-containing protein [Priestia aryabhattai]WEA46856.1 DUF4352 domain-containing protein [Priestia aryabhattai]